MMALPPSGFRSRVTQVSELSRRKRFTNFCYIYFKQSMAMDTERVQCTLALILGLQNRSIASVLGYNLESCKNYSKLRINYLICSSEEWEQSVLFTEAVGKSHAFNDGGAVIGV